MTLKKLAVITDGTQEITIEQDLADGSLLLTTVDNGTIKTRSTSYSRLQDELNNGTLRHPASVYKYLLP